MRRLSLEVGWKRCEVTDENDRSWEGHGKEGEKELGGTVLVFLLLMILFHPLSCWSLFVVSLVCFLLHLLLLRVFLGRYLFLASVLDGPPAEIPFSSTMIVSMAAKIAPREL